MEQQNNKTGNEGRGASALMRWLAPREIKFRAWDIGCKEMRYYNWDDLLDGGFDYQTMLEYHDDGQLMQFTGITDDNRSEIYEGDIIRLFHGYEAPEDYDYHIVVWGGEDYPAWTLRPDMYTESNVFSYLKHSREARYFEVAGNIFENPELIP